nr:MAG TPA: hypothetical protein [Caudoviricetes sp.]
MLDFLSCQKPHRNAILYIHIPTYSHKIEKEQPPHKDKLLFLIH